MEHAYYLRFTYFISVFDHKYKFGYALTLICFVWLVITFCPGWLPNKHQQDNCIVTVGCLRWWLLLLFIVFLTSADPNIWVNMKGLIQYVTEENWRAGLISLNSLFSSAIGQKFFSRHSRHVSFTVVILLSLKLTKIKHHLYSQKQNKVAWCFQCAVAVSSETVASFGKNGSFLLNWYGCVDLLQSAVAMLSADDVPF